MNLLAKPYATLQRNVLDVSTFQVAKASETTLEEASDDASAEALAYSSLVPAVPPAVPGVTATLSGTQAGYFVWSNFTKVAEATAAYAADVAAQTAREAGAPDVPGPKDIAKAVVKVFDPKAVQGAVTAAATGAATGLGAPSPAPAPAPA
mmetsp:Transcript_56479/g.150492  ORF Transcript_56479/g.150492 Transcript_56479/m.150492 type:complete len:150 (+) Transcript_56479:618-1067(+)